MKYFRAACCVLLVLLTIVLGASAQTTTPAACATKHRGDADCVGGIMPADYEVWRREYIGNINGSCSDANLTATSCLYDADGVGGLMDADFNADNKVSLGDYQIWRRNRVK